MRISSATARLVPMRTHRRLMKGLRPSLARIMAAILVCLLIVVAAALGPLLGVGQDSKKDTPSPTGSVLDASYAKRIGFPDIYQAAKKSTVTGQKGCPTSIESIYENLSNKTALISEVLNCTTSADATASLISGRKQVKVDTSFAVPKELGSSAFATAAEQPEYLVVWTIGVKVAVVGLDVDISGSSSSSSTATASPPITKGQQKMLIDAALEAGFPL